MANNALIGALRVEASLDSGKFVDGARKIRTESKQTETQVKRSFGGMGDSAKAGIAGFVGALSVGLFTKAVKAALDYAAGLKATAEQLGVTTKFLQEFRFAAGQVGTSQEQADKGLEQFNLNLSKAASGSEKAQKAFAAVGVSLSDIKTGDKAKILGEIADTMNKQGGAAKNAAAGNAIFGEGFSKLVPVLDQGSKGMDELRAAADRLGIVLSDDQIQHADETANKLDALQKVLRQEFASTVVANADSIYTLSKALANLTGEILHFLNSNPGLAVGFIGALAGSRFGIAGAAIGGAAGALLGENMGRNAADSNMDLRFRKQALIDANNELNARKAAQADKGSLISFRQGSGRGGTVDGAFKEWQRQMGLLQTAIATAKRPGAPPGSVPTFLAKPPRTPRTPRPRSGPRPPQDRSDDVAAQFEREQMQADRDVLQAKQQLAGSSEERAAISLQLIDLDHDTQAAEIDDRVRRARRDEAEGHITADALRQVEIQADILRGKNDQKTAIDKQAFVEAQLARAEQAQFEASDQQRRFTLGALQAADQLATTAADHRRIQLQILDSEIEQKRLELEHQKQLAIRNGATADEIKVIQDKIDHLPAERAQGAAQIVQGTRNPLEEWAAQVPKTADEINAALQSIEVQGLDGLTDALTDVLMGTKSIKEGFHELAASILADLIKMTIKMLLFKALESAIGGGFGGGVSSGGSSFISDSGFSFTGFAEGGFVSGPGSSTSDNVPAMLSNGEYVVSAKAVARWLPALESINSGKMPHMRDGGLVRAMPMPQVSLGVSTGAATIDAGSMAQPIILQTFDLNGAVVTSELLRQMDEKSQMAAEAGAKMGVERMVDLNARTYGKALGGR